MPQGQSFSQLLTAQEKRNLTCALWLQDLRRAAIARFKQLSPPNRRDEHYRYVNLRDLLNTEYLDQPSSHQHAEQARHIAEQCQQQAHVYVFVDGALAATANPLPTQLTSVKELMASDTTDVAQLLVGGDYFQQLNLACFQDGAYIVIPEDSEIKYPIYLIYVSSTAAQAVCYRNIINVQAHSYVRIVERYISIGEANSHFTNACTQLYLRPEAQCSYIKLQSEAHAVNHISMCDIHQQRGSNLQMFTLANGSKLTRMSTNIIKQDEATVCDFRYGYLGSDTQTFDCIANVEHRQPKGKTTQLVRGIVRDQARGIFTGKIKVLKEAQQISATQQSKNILIGNECAVYMRPQLQIKADDVECSHGATSAKISPRDLLYLQSRGISSTVAMRLISDAHLGALLEGFTAKDLVEESLRQASAKFWPS